MGTAARAWPVLGVIVLMACGGVRTRSGSNVTLTVLPAESFKFPQVARAITESMREVKIAGVDRTELSNVSLEVAQLSIECVEQTPACYEAVGKSLSADRLLFAHLQPTGRKQITVTVTLFDVDTGSPKTAQKVFANEQQATAGVADLVAEATR